MKIKDKKVERRLKVRKRIRGRLHGTLDRPRLSVFKSNTCMEVQLINDEKGETLVASSSRKVKTTNDVSGALELGRAIAEQAVSKGITTIVFDRSGYPYRGGKIEALADGAREKGLKF